MNKTIKYLLFVPAVLLTACKSDLNTKVSNTTGWNYYDMKTTNFEAKEMTLADAPKPVGMVFIEGGSFTVGQKDEFITAPRNNTNRTVTVSPFYMDKYEITTLNWNEYLHWLDVVFGKVAPELVEKARPNRNVWREEMAFNDPYIENYFDHPSYSFYPVVGVTWNQAMDYCEWRTDRVNEMNLIRGGYIEWPAFADLEPLETEEEKEEWETENGYTMDRLEEIDPQDPANPIVTYRVPYEYLRDKFVFNTDKYLYDPNYQPELGRRAPKEEKVTIADGVLVTHYRLPTEAEWEFAAYAPVAGEDGLTIEGKLYPWSGYHPRDTKNSKTMGAMQANFVRGRGDMSGVSGARNDAHVVTARVDEFQPNDFGLYNMAGNVNEWVLDVYRETSNVETSEYNSFRGNIYKDFVKDENGAYVIDSLGRLAKTFQQENDKRNFRDGDRQSRIDTDYPLDTVGIENPKVDPTDILAPRITNTTRVYKGGSWNDRIYWLNPSTRRYLDEDKSSSTIGFRCAMSSLGN